jgi:DNA invertase Pin-like site-specific DNA recombinase
LEDIFRGVRLRAALAAVAAALVLFAGAGTSLASGASRPTGAAGGQAVGSAEALTLGLALALGALGGVGVARARSIRGRTRPKYSGRPEEQPDKGHGEQRGRADLRQPTGSGRPPRLELIAPADRRKGPRQVLGCVSAPEDEGAAGPSLEAQAEAVQRLCEQRGWTLRRVVRDVEKGRVKALQRPGLWYALERIAEGEADCLVVPSLERLARSAAELGRLVEAIENRDGRLVGIDLRLDTGTAGGRLIARTLVTVGEWETRWIADRTRKGLAAARARRGTTGPPAVADRPEIKQLIVGLRKQGLTLQAIADRLNEEGVPTLRGGTKWRPSSVEAAAGYRRPSSRGAGSADRYARTEQGSRRTHADSAGA